MVELGGGWVGEDIGAATTALLVAKVRFVSLRATECGTFLLVETWSSRAVFYTKFHTKLETCTIVLKYASYLYVLRVASLIMQDSTVRLWDINEAKGCKALRKFSGHEGSVGVRTVISNLFPVVCVLPHS